MTSLSLFCAGSLLAVLLRWSVRAICAWWFGDANHQEPPDLRNSQPDLGGWDGEPMDWLASLGAGALFVGIGLAIIADLVILAVNPQGPYVSDVLRAAGRQHPFLIFAAGAVCAHLFWTAVGPK